MQSNPRISASVLVILAKTPVNLLVKLTKLGQGGAIGALGLQGWTTCRFHVPRGLAPGLPTSSRACTCWRKGKGATPLGAMGTTGLAPRPRRNTRNGKKTATPLRLSPIFPTFLGYILGVLSDDLVVGR